MKEGPLPDWLRHKIVEVVAAYRATIHLCDERCAKLEAEGLAGDDYGEVRDYRMDAKYCAGQATRAPLLLLECLTQDELNAIARILRARLPKDPLDPDAYEMQLRRLEFGPAAWKEVVTDPAKIAPLAFRRPMRIPEPIPDPPDAMEDLRATTLFQELSDREAEAIILTKVCQLKAEQAAAIMRCSVDHVNMAVYRGKKRLRESLRFREEVRKATGYQV